MELNVYEAKTNFSKLVNSLIERENDIIYIAKNGKPVIQMTLIPQKKNKLIGAGKGILHDFDFEDFQSADEEITKNFNGDLV